MAAEKETSLKNAFGFHVRPVTMFMKLANNFKSDITVSANGNTVSGRSAMELISLGVVKGDIIKVTCDGEDEEEALKQLIELIDSSFNGIE